MESQEATKANAGLIGSSEHHAIKAGCGRSEAEKYVRNQGPRFHPIFSVATPLDDQRVQHKLDRSGPLRSQTDQFYHVVEIYQTKITKDNILPPKFTIRGKHTWDEVFQAAKDASNQSQNPRGFKRWMNTVGREATKKAPFVEPLLGLLPEGDYTGTLCGGLKLAFRIAARMKERREAILDAFESLPTTIQQAQDCRARHPDDLALYDAASDLYLAILDAVVCMMYWLVGSSAWKRYWSVIPQSLTERPMGAGLLEVQKKTERLRYRAEKLESDITVETNVIVKDIESDFKHTNATIQELHVNVERVGINTQHTENKTNDIHELVTEMASDVKELNTMQMAQQESAVIVSSRLIDLIQDQIKGSLWCKKREQYKKDRQKLRLEKEKVREEQREVLEKQIQLRETELELYRKWAQGLKTQRQLKSVSSAFPQQQLRTLLDVPDEKDARDLEQVSRLGKHGPSSSHTQSFWLLSHSSFRTWLKSNESQSLLLDGNNPTSERISASSIVCATLLQSLKESQQATPISFFCSLHTGESASLRGPQGLMRNLLHQLLPIQDFDLSFINDSYAEKVYSQDLLCLCDLFERLVNQLDEDRVLFCIIDSVSSFEKQKYGNGILLVVDRLLMLTRRLGSAHVFKLLLAGPKVSKHMRTRFSSDDCITVKKGSEDGRVLTSNYLSRHTRRLFDAQEKSPATIPPNDDRPEDGHEDSSFLTELNSDSDEEDDKFTSDADGKDSSSVLADDVSNEGSASHSAPLSSRIPLSMLTK